jgi:hypothetical protein
MSLYQSKLFLLGRIMIVNEGTMYQIEKLCYAADISGCEWEQDHDWVDYPSDARVFASEEEVDAELARLQKVHSDWRMVVIAINNGASESLVVYPNEMRAILEEFRSRINELSQQPYIRVNTDKKMDDLLKQYCFELFGGYNEFSERFDKPLSKEPVRQPVSGDDELPQARRKYNE